jgi:CheY-like chemotaxis protein
MTSEQFTFLVVENAIDVCEGLERRMQAFEKWKSLGYCLGVKEAGEKILSQKPDLIFLDWSLNGGSAFEILQEIQNLSEYNPYIIFNTGFQSDHPEIPQEIINSYKVDKYLVKPFWENLRNHLSSYLKEAEDKSRNQLPKLKLLWIEDVHGEKIPLPVNRIICVIQHQENPRWKDFYIAGKQKEITLHISWENCYDILNDAQINYFVTKRRGHLVVKKYIECLEKPFVRVQELPFKVEVVKERIKKFREWLNE